MSPENKDKVLFSQFPPVSTEEWEALITKDLKGANYEKKLLRPTEDGFRIRPYYRAEDLAGLSHMDSLPGQFPYVRGNKAGGNDWEIRQDIDNPDLKAANSIALKAISKGAQGIGFNAKRVVSPIHMHRLLEGINLEETSIHFISAYFYPALAELFLEDVISRGLDPNKIRGSFNFDSLGYYILYGEYYATPTENFDEAAHLIERVHDKLPHFRVMNVNAQHFHNGGASIVQELAFALAEGNEYLAQLTDRGYSVDQLAPHMKFTFALGSDYFLEIAKLRAARMLWARIVEQYAPASPEAGRMFIHGTGSYWNKTVYDPYVNILRSTTEGMAGAIGMCDSIHLRAFDKTYRYADAFSRRVSQNIQNLLKEEAYFNKVADPAAGSYYIENLTHMVAEKSWELFREVEAMGGFLQASKGRFFIRTITKTRKELDKAIGLRIKPVLGSSQYPNLEEKMLDKLEKEVFTEDLGGIPQYRAAEPFEKLRLATERFVLEDDGFQPAVYLLTWGNLAMRKARANFSANFYGVAGYGITDTDGFGTFREACLAAAESAADIVVLCSSDDDYADIDAATLGLIKAKKRNTQIILAGNPGEKEKELRKAGISDFIHVKTNLLLSLQEMNKQFGIQ